MLMPKHAGNLQIPRIAFGNDSSNAVTINVSPASAGGGAIANDLVYLEANVDNKSVYVQSQLVYTLRIYHAVQLRNASLNELKVSDSDAVIEKLSENKSYEKMINGRRYRVFEKQFAIFPQTPGELVIEPAVLDAQYIDLPRVMRTKRLVSETLKVTVKPVPHQARQTQSAYWLPASSLTLTEEWSNGSDEINAGDPVTRTLTLTAGGLLSAQLPVLGGIDAGAGIKQYADQPVLENVISNGGFSAKRQEKIAYIPTQPGSIKLPPITVTWWNTEKDRMETATLPARTIKVAGAAAVQSRNAGQPEPDVAAAKGQDNSGDAVRITDETKNDAASIAGFSAPLWFGISVALLILWLLTLATWYMSTRGRSQRNITISNEGRGHLPVKAILKQVKSACDANDPRQVKNVLLQWGHEQWPQQPPTSLGHMAQRVNGRLAGELKQLNALLYKPGAAPWNGRGLWQSLEEYTQDNHKQKTPSASTIRPLYRIAQTSDD
jgi:hypothetical protein